jgi:hypothetical protein
MTRPALTRYGARIALTILALSALLGYPPPALAQQGEVRLRLVDQTPWTTPARPLLSITFEATNSGAQQLSDLSVGLTIGQPIRARLVYEQSLASGPGAFPIYGPIATSKAGNLDPGQTKRFTISLSLGKVPGVSGIDSLVYPLAVDLRSRGEVVASANSAEINFVKTLEAPLMITWWAEITAPIALDPQGRLADPAFAASISPGGTLRSEAEALRDLVRTSPATAIHLAVEPAVLEQLSSIASGIASGSTSAGGSLTSGGAKAADDAAAVLADLKTAAAGPSSQVSALPFSAPSIPSLIDGGLSRDLDRQRAAGASVISRLLGVAADPTVIRPPGGALDTPSLQALAAHGVATLLGDADTVSRPVQPNDFAPPPVAVLATSRGSLNVVLPDPHITALMQNQSLIADPMLAAQALLGEIATIWREQPVPIAPTVRGIAVALPADLPAGVWAPLLMRVGHAPFLEIVQPTELVSRVEPKGMSEPLLHPVSSTFSGSYAASIHTERDNLAAYRAMLLPLVDPSSDRLERCLLYAEAGAYVGDEIQGRAWYDFVHNSLTSIFNKAAPDTSQVFTFTSSNGTIPIRMGDPGPLPLHVIIVLRSSRFTFPSGDSQFVTLTKPHQIVLFRVDTAARGQGVILVYLQAPKPSGKFVAQETLVVRSTQVNKIAVIITLAAGLLLVALWSRRLFRRRTS